MEDNKLEPRRATAVLAGELGCIMEDLGASLKVLQERRVAGVPVDPVTEEEAALPAPGSLKKAAVSDGPTARQPSERTRLQRTLSAAIPVGPEIAEEPSLDDLAGIVAHCRRCALAEKRKRVVFGEGTSKIPLMLIGEGPGATEDDTGRPFVGRAGQLLTSMLEAISLRREDIYVTNIVKCRPPGNRDPKTEETSACRPFLDRQRQLLSPAVVVALGRPATQTLLESTAPLGRLRGQFHSFQKAELLVTYHPAFLLRTPSMKAEAWKDLKLLRARLEELKLVKPAGRPWWKEGGAS